MLSVVLATFNEEENITECLDSIKDIASEIIVVDGTSTDKTVEAAKKYTDKIIITSNPVIFHINKQKALNAATNQWILQVDADERVTAELAKEIVKIIVMSDRKLEEYQNSLPDKKLFVRHQRLIEQRDGRVGDKEGHYNAFFIPRRNFFLGGYLKYGGTYPDPAIRLVKKGKAFFPCKSVHEMMQVQGRVGWLQNCMLHKDSPTFERYLVRNNRYINLMVDEMKKNKLPKNLINFANYLIAKPFFWFFWTQFRHKGILDGFPGVIFSFFSALRFPRAYLRYIKI